VFCRFCGVQVADDAKFCASCGRPIAVQSAASPEQAANIPTKTTGPKNELPSTDLSWLLTASAFSAIVVVWFFFPLKGSGINFVLFPLTGAAMMAALALVIVGPFHLLRRNKEKGKFRRNWVMTSAVLTVLTFWGGGGA
jgi:hypothetical protein